MSGDACAIAAGAVSGLGLGDDAFSAGAPFEPARVVLGHDETLARAGLTRPFAARAPELPDAVAFGDRATDLLHFALAGAASTLDAVRPGWRRERVGIAIGTSSGGML